MLNQGSAKKTQEKRALLCKPRALLCKKVVIRIHAN
jgi:hypothetical protein